MLHGSEVLYRGSFPELPVQEIDRKNSLRILLLKAMLKSFDYTIEELIGEQEEIFYLTIKSRNSLVYKLAGQNLS